MLPVAKIEEAVGRAASVDPLGPEVEWSTLVFDCHNSASDTVSGLDHLAPLL